MFDTLGKILPLIENLNYSWSCYKSKGDNIISYKYYNSYKKKNKRKIYF